MNIKLLSCLTLLLVGCASTVEYPSPEINPPEKFYADDILKELNQGKHILIERQNWWLGYQDPTLNQLVEKALIQNHQLIAAAERLQASRSQFNRLNAEQGWQLKGSANATQQNKWQPTHDEEQTLQVGLAASVEIDLNDKQQHQRDAAQAEIQTAQAEFNQLTLLTSSQVVQHYLKLRANQKQLKLYQQKQQLLTQKLHITEGLLNAGLGEPLAISELQAELAATRSEQPELQRLIKQSSNQLALLLGSYQPELDWLIDDRDAPQYQHAVPQLLPLTVLLNHHKVQQAEAQLKQAIADIGIAHSQLYPELSLSAQLRLSSNKIWLPSSDALITSLIALLSQTLFDGGARQAEQQTALAKAKAAMADYQQQLRETSSQINQALNNLQATHQQLQNKQQQQYQRQQVLNQTQSLYDAGLVNQLELLAKQQLLQQVEISLDREQINLQIEIALLFGEIAGRE